MDDKNLKPCLFCGGQAVFVPLSTCSGYIACVDCNIAIKTVWDDRLNRIKNGETWDEKAAKMWNRRYERCQHF